MRNLGLIEQAQDREVDVVARHLPQIVGQEVEDDVLLERLARTFKDVGYLCRRHESCLLTMLSPPRTAQNACGEAIAGIFHRLIAALAGIAHQAGATVEDAGCRAEEVLVTVQGAPVVTRGIGEPAVFERALARLPGIIISDRTS